MYLDILGISPSECLMHHDYLSLLTFLPNLSETHPQKSELMTWVLQKLAACTSSQVSGVLLMLKFRLAASRIIPADRSYDRLLPRSRPHVASPEPYRPR